MVDEDFVWKMVSFYTAAREIIERDGALDTEECFKRAKYIYDEGYKQNYVKYDSFFKKYSKEEKKSQDKKTGTEDAEFTERKIEVRHGKKVCPGCGDEVPQSMKVHHVGKKGKCGYRWKDEENIE